MDKLTKMLLAEEHIYTLDDLRKKVASLESELRQYKEILEKEEKE